jgi:hypothetical protein
MSSEVTELLTALQDGTMSLQQVAQRFRERSWPRSRRVEPRTYLELAEAAQNDPEPLVPGSFDEVAAAYYRGDLTRPDYRILAEAAAASMREEDMRKGSDI